MTKSVLRSIVVGAVAVILGGALGAVGGWLWWTWWSPGYDGRVYDTTIGPRWFPDATGPGEAHQFSSVAMYVVIGLGAGLLLGLATAFLARNRAVLGVGYAILGSAVGAAVMWAVGMGLSPEDPRQLAAKDTIGDRLPQGLVLDGFTPYLVWPVGALFAFTAVMVLTAGALNLRGREGDPAWLPAGGPDATNDRSAPSPLP